MPFARSWDLAELANSEKVIVLYCVGDRLIIWPQLGFVPACAVLGLHSAGSSSNAPHLICTACALRQSQAAAGMLGWEQMPEFDGAILSFCVGKLCPASVSHALPRGIRSGCLPDSGCPLPWIGILAASLLHDSTL